MADKKITELDLATTIEDEASFIIAQTEGGQTKAKRTLLSTIIAKLPFYKKPSGGIPKTDLASAVQTSLGRADSALQSVPGTYRTASAQDAIDAGKQDKITSSNKLSYSLLKDTPTIPTVPTNVSAFNNDSGYLTMATLPIYDGSVI